MRDTSDSNESFSFLKGSTSTYEDSKVFFNGLNGRKFYYNSSQDKIGFIPHSTDDIPVPPQFQIPSSCQLNMSPHELELMLFINENFLSPSIFDKVILIVDHVCTTRLLQLTGSMKHSTIHQPLIVECSGSSPSVYLLVSNI